MPVLHLRPDLYHCLANGRSIFLDLDRNQYFTISASLEAYFQHLSAGRELKQSDPAVRLLVAEGVLVASDHRPDLSERRQCDVPKASVYADALPRPTRRSVVRLVVRRALVTAMLRHGSLKSILARRVARKQGLAVRSSPPGAAIAAIVSSLRLSEKLLSSHGRCLSSSIAVLDELIEQGHRADLIFGVSGAPFAAHCWVQTGDLVINDSLENVKLYTPLLCI